MYTYTHMCTHALAHTYLSCTYMNNTHTHTHTHTYLGLAQAELRGDAVLGAAQGHGAEHARQPAVAQRLVAHLQAEEAGG